MNKITSFILGGIAGMYIMHQIDTYKPEVNPTAIYEGTKVELYTENEDADTSGSLEKSMADYAVDINPDPKKETVVPITRNNLYLNRRGNFYRTRKGYESALEKMKTQGRGKFYHPAVLHNDTLYTIHPEDLYVGSDGLGYFKHQ